MHTSRFLVASIFAPLLSIGCGVAPQSKEAETNPTARITISQGVYGVVTRLDDVCAAPCATTPLALDLQLRDPAGASPYAIRSSGSDGFYEVAAEPGTYDLCTSFGRCERIVLRDGERLRADYELGVGPGWTVAHR